MLNADAPERHNLRAHDRRGRGPGEQPDPAARQRYREGHGDGDGDGAAPEWQRRRPALRARPARPPQPRKERPRFRYECPAHPAIAGAGPSANTASTCESLRRVCREFAPVRFRPYHRGQNVADIVSVERLLAGQQFVQHGAEGKDVGRLVDMFAARLLRAHIGSRAHDYALHRRRHAQGRRIAHVFARCIRRESPWPARSPAPSRGPRESPSHWRVSDRGG